MYRREGDPSDGPHAYENKGRIKSSAPRNFSNLARPAATVIHAEE